MDYILAHALEIFWLTLSVCLFALTLLVSRTILKINRILTKIDDLTEIFIEYIQKPIAMILQVQSIVSKIFRMFIK